MKETKSPSLLPRDLQPSWQKDAGNRRKVQGGELSSLEARGVEFYLGMPGMVSKDRQRKKKRETVRAEE